MPVLSVQEHFARLRLSNPKNDPEKESVSRLPADYAAVVCKACIIHISIPKMSGDYVLEASMVAPVDRDLICFPLLDFFFCLLIASVFISGWV